LYSADPRWSLTGSRLSLRRAQQRERVLDARRALVTERSWYLQVTLLDLLDAHLAGVTVTLSNGVKRALMTLAQLQSFVLVARHGVAGPI
jgi:hypothetical protein